MLATRNIIWLLVLMGCAEPHEGHNYATAMEVKTIPAQVVKKVGDSVMFGCMVVGDAQDIDWYDPSGKKISSYVTRDRLTTDIVIHQVSLDDAGLYRCVAKNSVEEAEATVLLDIYQPITFQDVSSPQTFNEGDDAEIICNVVGSPKPEVSWRFDGSRINYKNDARFHLLSNNHLQVRSVKKTDEGMYTCTAMVQSIGEISFKEIEVLVKAKVRVTDSDEVTMTCETSDDPTSTVSCTFKNQKIQDVQQLTKSGQFLCTASSSDASERKNMYLQFHYVPEKIYTREGSPTNITCDFSAPTVVWLKDGVEIKESNKVKIYMTPTASYLQVTPDSQNDFGRYTCRETSMPGTKSMNFLLISAGVPDDGLRPSG